MLIIENKIMIGRSVSVRVIKNNVGSNLII